MDSKKLGEGAVIKMKTIPSIMLWLKSVLISGNLQDSIFRKYEAKNQRKKKRKVLQGVGFGVWGMGCGVWGVDVGVGCGAWVLGGKGMIGWNLQNRFTHLASNRLVSYNTFVCTINTKRHN